MIKKVWKWIFICGAIFLVGCANQNISNSVEDSKTKQEAGVNKMEEKTKIEKLFPNVEGAWVGDIMAQSDEFGIHLNYLYETDYNAVGYHPIHRFTTTNFTAYTDDGEMIPFGTKLEDPDLAVGTGCFIQDQQGKFHCFYTGHNDKSSELKIDKECIMHAESEDNKNWTKILEDTFYAPEGYSSDDYRDPQVFWNEKEQCYWMLVGGKQEDKNGSCILKYTSNDLKNWKFCGNFYEQEDLYFMECPDLFQINDWYYLVFSWNNVTYYRMTKNLSGPWITPDMDTFDGNAFYAAKTVDYENSRYLIGFIDRKKSGDDKSAYTWAGSLCPYELVQKKDGILGVKMPHQYEQYFTKKVKKAPKLDKIEKTTIVGKLPTTMMVSCDVTFHSDDGKAGFVFGTGKGSDGYSVLLNQRSNKISYDAYPNEQSFVFKKGKTYNLKLVVENEIVIVYVNETKVLSNRIYEAVDRNWGFLIRNGNVEFSNISIQTR